MNTVLNLVFSQPTRRSQARARDMPAPTATPLTAAMVGLFSSRETIMAWRPTQPNSSSLSCRPETSGLSRLAVRSTPEQKPRPAPVQMTTLISSSSLSSRHTCIIS